MVCALSLRVISAKLGCSKSKTDSPDHCGNIASNANISANNKMAASSSNSLFPAASSQQRLTVNSGGGATRSKVALKPGRSLMDWIRLGRSGKDLTGVGGKLFSITMEELKKHNKPDDAWIALRGKVYNISPYLEYHPGGVDELMRGAGVDGTQLFDEIHKWVNAESMLEKCYVGKLKTESPASGKDSRKSSKGIPQTLGPNGAITQTAPFKIPESHIPTYDWFQSSKSVTLVVYTRWKIITPDHVTIDKTNLTLRVAVTIEKHTFKIHLELQEEVTTDYTVKVHPDSGKVDIVLPKSLPDKQWSALGKPLRGDKSYVKTFQAETVYRECRVQSISAVTHDVILLTINPPEGCRLPVPIGHHVQIKHKAQGMEIARSYTAVLPSLDKDEQDPNVDEGRVIYLMIKIYSNGAVTPFIGTLNAGETVTLSDSDGSFDLPRLSGVTHLILLAAGTGFTPMVRLIYHSLTNPSLNKIRKVRLLFYNKKICDIMWQEQLDALVEQHSRFRVTHILSDEPSWEGIKGRVCADHIRQFVPCPNSSSDLPSTSVDSNESQPVDQSESGDTSTSAAVIDIVQQDSCADLQNPLVCVCGPTPFTNLATQLLKERGLSNKHIYLFQG